MPQCLCQVSVSFSLPKCLLCPASLSCQVGDDNVHSALSLVGFEPELQKAMEYVFGTTLVCDTLDNARKVAFDKRVMTKTVTLGGDIVNPQGTLTGGECQDHAHVVVSSRESKTSEDDLGCGCRSSPN